MGLAELVQVMDWHQLGNKPLPEPTFTQFTDVYMRHQAQVGLTHCGLETPWYGDIDLGQHWLRY